MRAKRPAGSPPELGTLTQGRSDNPRPEQTSLPREDPRAAVKPQRLDAPSKRLAPKTKKGRADETSTVILPKFANN